MSDKGFVSCLHKEEQDVYETKNEAAEFYRVNRIPEQTEKALNELFLYLP